MSKSLLLGAVALMICVPMDASLATAQQYSAEMIASGPDADGASEEILKQMASEGVRVKRGSSRTACEIWLCKDLAVDPDFKATPERLYPFSPGQLIGLLHFGRRGSEFRDQTISSGWYTLRFGLQPIDGNHEGTSPTRDFLLLVDAETDDLPEAWKTEDLHEASSGAAGSSHPAMLCLQRPSEGPELSIKHDESNDWWVLHVIGNGVANGKTQGVPIDLVVAGHAAE